MEILISDRQEMPLSKKLIKELSLRVLEMEKAAIASELSISLVTPMEMRELNKRWRDIDKATDVLSFSLKEPTDNFLGDLILCPQEAKKIAFEQEEDFSARLILLVIHGILHLLGYNHKNSSQAKVMEKKEEQLLEELGELNIV